jgi:hypothetical protein
VSGTRKFFDFPTSQNSAGRKRIKEEYSFKDMVQIAGGF